MATEAEDFQAAQIAEWGAFVAVRPIDIGGVRAFNPGDPVPKSHVDRGVVDPDDVAAPSSDAAHAVTGEI